MATHTAPRASKSQPVITLPKRLHHIYELDRAIGPLLDAATSDEYLALRTALTQYLNTDPRLRAEYEARYAGLL